MRALLFVLMIALLLLRGWTGDAMANDMALASLHQPQQSTTKTIAAHAYGISEKAHFHPESAIPEASNAAQAAHDCAGHAADGAAPAADGHCQSCDACQACHSVALIPSIVEAAPVFGSRSRPHAMAARFASAEAAPGQKPPIS
jgi:hypothetical protein